MVGAYLGIHARTLEGSLRRQLVAAPGSRNPLFLRTVLEELRQFGSFERLPERVKHYLEAGRAEGVVSARHRSLAGGLRRRHRARPPRADPPLGRPRGALGIGVARLARQPRRTAAARLLDAALPRAGTPPQPAVRALRLRPRLHPSGRGERRSCPPRMTARQPILPWRITSGSGGDDTAQSGRVAMATERRQGVGASGACLTDIDAVPCPLQRRDQWELTGYWHPLRKWGATWGLCRRDWRLEPRPGRADNARVPYQLGAFLEQNGLYASAEPLTRRALENGNGSLRGATFRAMYLAGLAGLLIVKATTRRRSHCTSARSRPAKGSRGGASRHPEVPGRLGQSVLARGDLAGAQPMLKRALEAQAESLGRRIAKPWRMGNLASLHLAKGDYARAQPLAARALEAAERALGRGASPNPAVRGSLGGFHRAQGRLRRGAVAIRANAGGQRASPWRGASRNPAERRQHGGSV